MDAMYLDPQAEFIVQLAGINLPGGFSLSMSWQSRRHPLPLKKSWVSKG